MWARWRLDPPAREQRIESTERHAYLVRGKAQGSSLIWIERFRRVSWSG